VSALTQVRFATSLPKHLQPKKTARRSKI
jgi:hypothetical protein